MMLDQLRPFRSRVLMQVRRKQVVREPTARRTGYRRKTRKTMTTIVSCNGVSRRRLRWRIEEWRIAFRNKKTWKHNQRTMLKMNKQRRKINQRIWSKKSMRLSHWSFIIPIRKNMKRPSAHNIVWVGLYDTRNVFDVCEQGKRTHLPHPIRDDIDRFDGLYTCLTEETVRAKNGATSGNRLNDYLRQRFFSLSNINELRNFQQSEFLRTFDEKRINQARVPFVPNLLASQRTCTTDQVEDLIWIRDHLC